MLQLADEIWVEECWIRFLGFQLQTRMAVLRLGGRKLLVYSPVFLTADVREKLDELGDVAWIVSPNKIHNQTLTAYRTAWSDAALLAPPGLPERRRELEFDAVLDRHGQDAWRSEVDVAVTAGNTFFSEVLLYHRRSKTLLVGDLVENLRDESTSRVGQLALGLFGLKRPAASPEFRWYTHDAAAFETSLSAARAWAFERIFLCHGELIRDDAAGVFGTVCDELSTIVRGRGATMRAVMRTLARLQ